jgi:hypothetical protein
MHGDVDGVALSHHMSKHCPWIGLLVTSAYLAAQSKGPSGRVHVPSEANRSRVVDHIRELTGAA